MSRLARAAALLLTAALLVASTSVSAEPGKDPGGHSAQAPGQNKDKQHGHDKETEGPDIAPPAAQNWRLNLVVRDVAGINAEALRMIREHLEAGVPVTLEAAPDVISTLAGLEDIKNLLGPESLVPALPEPRAPGPVPQGEPASEPMSEEECFPLVIGVMDDPPFLDPGIQPECIPDEAPNLPLDDIPTPRLPPLPIPVNLDIGG